MVAEDAARSALRAFLSTRRARLSPEDSGLVAGPRRRVTGLRREEVAMLAGISAEYYVRLERGLATGPSPGVVDSSPRPCAWTRTNARTWAGCWPSSPPRPGSVVAVRSRNGWAPGSRWCWTR